MKTNFKHSRWITSRAFGVALAAALSLALGTTASAIPTQWETSDGGNGHYYMPVLAPESGIGWEDARRDAEDLGGHLVTISSGAENAFVYNLVDSPEYFSTDATGRSRFGPWLGAAQPEGETDPAANWNWVSGEDSSYTNWWSGEPNDFNGMEERYLQFYGLDQRSSQWNDMFDTWLGASFVVEYDDIMDYHLAVNPEPTSAVLGAMGLLAIGGLAGGRRMRRRPELE